MYRHPVEEAVRAFGIFWLMIFTVMLLGEHWTTIIGWLPDLAGGSPSPPLRSAAASPLLPYVVALGVVGCLGQWIFNAVHRH